LLAIVVSSRRQESPPAAALVIVSSAASVARHAAPRYQLAEAVQFGKDKRRAARYRGSSRRNRFAAQATWARPEPQHATITLKPKLGI
jgi:hypothetical protein